MIQGRPALKPEAMRALVMAAGHLFVLSEGDGYAEVTAHRNDWPEDMRTTYRYDLDDARLAGLTGKDNWKKQPRAMLAARATGGAARAWFADVIAGMSYTTEEVKDFSPDQEVTPSPPTPTLLHRRRFRPHLPRSQHPRQLRSPGSAAAKPHRASRPRGPGDARGRPQRPRALHLAPLCRRLRRPL